MIQLFKGDIMSFKITCRVCHSSRFSALAYGNRLGDGILIVDRPNARLSASKTFSAYKDGALSRKAESRVTPRIQDSRGR